MLTPGRGRGPIRRLDAAADDYLVKPFCSRAGRPVLGTLSAGGAQQRAAVVNVGDLRLDPASRGLEWHHELV